MAQETFGRQVAFKASDTQRMALDAIAFELGMGPRGDTLLRDLDVSLAGFVRLWDVLRAQGRDAMVSQLSEVTGEDWSVRLASKGAVA